jgi:hypothetical protein
MSGPGAGKGPRLVGRGPLPNSALFGISRVVVLALVLGTAGVVRALSVSTFGTDPGTATTSSDTNTALTGKFNSVGLSSLAPGFAMDNVDLAPSATPEPASMALLGLGLTFLGMSARRRRAVHAGSQSLARVFEKADYLVSEREQ